jgi:hypothetical protein
VLASDNSRWCSGGLLSYREIEPDSGERLVETDLMDLCSIRNAFDSGTINPLRPVLNLRAAQLNAARCMTARVATVVDLSKRRVRSTKFA